jgi:glycine/D-amino acid oxidase-like deaminating enzyme
VDVVVIGGGIVGAASAYWLARGGASVALLEKGDIAGEQSGRNWGFVRQQGRDPAELPLMIASNRLWQQLPEELGVDVEWTQGGNLALTDDDATLERYRQWLEVAHNFDLDTQLVGDAQIRKLLPGVDRTWKGGLYTASDGHVNPVIATVAFADAAQKLGAQLIEGCTARSIEVAGNHVVGVETRAGRIDAPAIVCAAGIWSRQLLMTANVRLPQGIVKGTVAATSPVAALTSTGVWAKELAFRQTRSGSLVFAAGAVGEIDASMNSLGDLVSFLPTYLKNRQSFEVRLGGIRGLRRRAAMRAYRSDEPAPNQKAVTRGLAALESWFPGLRPLKVQWSWAGYIDGTPDSLPVIDALTNPNGLVVATGLSGHGLGLGPVIGQAVADLVLRGETKFDLRPNRLSRFTDGSTRKTRAIL